MQSLSVYNPRLNRTSTYSSKLIPTARVRLSHKLYRYFRFQQVCYTNKSRSIIVRAEQEEEEAEVDLELQLDEIELDMEERVEKAVEIAQENFSTVRTGRASADMVNKLEVNYYGAPTPLLQLASISVPDASQILIGPFDKSAMQDIEKAIMESDLGITPNNDGQKIRLVIPQLTAERRKEMSKTVSKMGEEAKVAVRNVRRDVLKKVGKLDLPEDTEKSFEGKVQKMTDKAVKQIEDQVSKKQQELERV